MMNNVIMALIISLFLHFFKILPLSIFSFSFLGVTALLLDVFPRPFSIVRGKLIISISFLAIQIL